MNLSSLDFKRPSAKRHLTLPIFDSTDKLLAFQAPIHQSEAEEMKYVRTVLKNHSVPNAFKGLSQVLEKTKFKSVHKEIVDFILQCLQSPLDIVECMKRDGVIPRSLSGDFDTSFLASHSPRRIRSSFSVAHIDKAQEKSEDTPPIDSTDYSDDDTSNLLIELLEAVPGMIPQLSKSECADFLATIPQILISLAPDPQILNTKGIPKFEYFKAAAQCATKIIKLNNKENNIIDEDDIAHLTKMIIMASFQLSSNIGDIIRMTKSKVSVYLSYLGECIPYIAAFLPIFDYEDNGLTLLLQQFWISIIAQTCGDLSYFAKNCRELKTIVEYIPPFISKHSQIDYQTLSASIQDLLSKLKYSQYQKRNEEIEGAFIKIAPTVPTKTISALPISDSILLLGIAVLEKLRSSHGYFSTMFGYFDVEFYPEFSQCLDAVIYPVFMSFQSYVSSLPNVGTVRTTVLPVVTHLFQKYVGHNPRILPFIEKVIQPFLDTHLSSIIAFNVMKAYLSTFVELRKEKSPRLEQYKIIGLKMFENAVNTAPNAFNAVLHSVINNSSPLIFSSNNDILSIVLELYPQSGSAAFAHQLTVKSKAIGALPYLSHRQIMKNECIEDRLLLLAFHFSKCSNPATANLMVVNASSELLIMVWNHIVLTPGYDANAFIQTLILHFTELTNSNKGIFDTSENIDINIIRYQATVFRFFHELVSISMFVDDILNILPPILSKKLNNSPAVSNAIFQLACIVAAAMTIPKTTVILHTSLIHYLIRIAMIAISFRSMPNIYRFLRKDDVKFLEIAINYFPEIIKNIRVVEDLKTITATKSNTAKIGEGEMKLLTDLIEITNNDQLIYQKLAELLCFVLCNENVLFQTYFEPSEKPNNAISLVNKYWVKPRNYNLNILLQFFWLIYPASIPGLIDTLHCSDQIMPLIPPLLSSYPYSSSHIPSIMAKISPSNLHLCEMMRPEESLILLKPEILENPVSSEYLIKCLEKLDIDQALLYIPQLVQAIQFDKNKSLQNLLMKYCEKSDGFCHFLLWNIASEKSRLAFDRDFLPLLVNLESDILCNMSSEAQQHYDNELQFINNISTISAKLLPMTFEERKTELVSELSNLLFTKDLYVPSNPEYIILEIDATHSIPLKSHSRVPILVSFKAKIDKERRPFPVSCIFKIEDDVRMDALMIQLIDRMLHIFSDAGIDSFLLPYRVYATGTRRGVIECIRNAKSRHELGEQTKMSLLNYFKAAYGQVGTPDFQRALNNFIMSMAPYSLVCYIFQVKDRHNANIMIDDQGHVIHIDFGFIFDISPGGNMKFEKAPFKLNSEMIELLGGSKSAQAFIAFEELFCRCFLAVRSRFEEIEAIAALMKDAGIPCFKQDSFKKLRDRFFLDKADTELQPNIESLISGSMNAYTTSAYDAFQLAQNGIFYI